MSKTCIFTENVFLYAFLYLITNNHFSFYILFTIILLEDSFLEFFLSNLSLMFNVAKINSQFFQEDMTMSHDDIER